MNKSLVVLMALAALFATAPSRGFAAQEAASPKPAAPEGLRVNLNTATAVELAGLPGIGPKMAARILAYREKNGRFRKVEELMNVKGIGEKNFTKLRPHLFVEATGAASSR